MDTAGGGSPLAERSLRQFVEAVVELASRIRRERTRFGAPTPSAATERVGGIVKVGRGIDRLLRTAAAYICAIEQRDVDRELQRVVGKREARSARATAGELATLLEALERERLLQSTIIEPIGRDLRRGAASSILRRTIDLRNRVAHHEEPKTDEVVRVLGAIETLTRDVAERAGIANAGA